MVGIEIKGGIKRGMQGGIRLCINLAALMHNAAEISEYCRTDICAVIKSNAYGHGMVETARALSRSCQMFAVARLYEARLLRQRGIRSPVLVLSEFDLNSIRYAAENNITLTVFSIEQLRQCVSREVASAVNLNVHIKVNTGMNRLGIKTISELKEIMSLSRGKVNVTGIYTHFSDGADAQNTAAQYGRFRIFSDTAKEINPFIKAHCAASDSIFCGEDYFMDMVRPGLSLYGYCGAAARRGVMLIPAMEAASCVLGTGTLQCGEAVGYGGKYVAEKDIRYAVVSAGYGDGYKRDFTGANVVINGRAYPVIGSVCMDMIIIAADETVTPGQRVLLMSDNCDICDISVRSFARRAKTIPYEILTSFTERAAREYIYPAGRLH